MAVKKTSLYIDEELLKKVKFKAYEEGIKANDIYNKAIEEYLKKGEK